MNSSRTLLVQYSDSDEELDSCSKEEKVESQIVVESKNAKKGRVGHAEINLKRKVHQHKCQFENGESQCKKKLLPLPEAIVTMFGDSEQSKVNDSSGRIRTFEHFEGDWPSFVYIPVKCNSDLMGFLVYLTTKASKIFPNLHAVDFNQLHITLSRTVSLRHYWIDPIVKSLKDSFSYFQSFRCHLDIPEMYTNDEKTRSFLGLRIILGEDKLKYMTKKIDNVFSEFGLSEYYKSPSFHLSFAWHLGDITEFAPRAFLEELMESIDSWLQANDDCRVLSINKILLKTGNKLINLN